MTIQKENTRVRMYRVRDDFTLPLPLFRHFDYGWCPFCELRHLIWTIHQLHIIQKLSCCKIRWGYWKVLVYLPNWIIFRNSPTNQTGKLSRTSYFPLLITVTEFVKMKSEFILHNVIFTDATRFIVISRTRMTACLCVVNWWRLELTTTPFIRDTISKTNQNAKQCTFISYQADMWRYCFVLILQ